jgi:hypothetical protein
VTLVAPGRLRVADPHGVVYEVHKRLPGFGAPTGIAYVHLPCFVGTSPLIGRFYSQVRVFACVCVPCLWVGELVGWLPLLLPGRCVCVVVGVVGCGLLGMAIKFQRMLTFVCCKGTA